MFVIFRRPVLSYNCWFTGEFVEGQEKLKLVVDTVYKSAKAIQSSLFDISSVEDSVDDHGTNDADLDQELQLDGDLVHDIEELGEEEQRMLYQGDPDADETDGEGAFSELELKMPAKDNFEESCLGRSEDDAIALSDDDDESTENEKPGSSLAYASNEADESEQSQLHDQGSVDRKVSANDPYDLLGDSRLYRIIFGDTALGLEVTLYERRIVVAKISPERQSRLGVDSKPAVGDIFASISGHSLGLITSLSATLLYLKRALQTPPVELMFVEAPVFIEAFQKQSLSKAVEKANSQQSVARSQNPSDVSSSPIDVIDLLFDD